MNVYMNYTREIVRIIRKILNIALFHHELFLLYLIQHKVRLIFFMQPNKRAIYNLCVKSTLSNFPSIYEIVLPFYRCCACVVVGRYVSYWFYRNTAAAAKQTIPQQQSTCARRSADETQ